MGTVAIANAKLAYAHWQEVTASPRWQELAAKGVYVTNAVEKQRLEGKQDRAVAPGQLSFDQMRQIYHYDDINPNTEVLPTRDLSVVPIKR